MAYKNVILRESLTIGPHRTIYLRQIKVFGTYHMSASVSRRLGLESAAGAEVGYRRISTRFRAEYDFGGFATSGAEEDLHNSI